MDLPYYAYLARTAPPLQLARALARRAQRLVLRRFAPRRRAQLGPGSQRRPALRSPSPRQPLLPPEAREATARLLRERFAGPCAAVLAEAHAARDGRLSIFGALHDCRLAPRAPGEPCAPLAFDRDPLGGARYDAEVPGPSVDLFVPGADAKAAWEVGRLSQLWRYGQARWLAGTPEERSSWARAFLHTLRQFRAACPAGQGVQWSCAMEVAARATNAALAFGLVCDDPVSGESARGELL